VSPSHLSRAVSLRQRDADDFFVIAGKDALVGKGRMAPDHVAVERLGGRLEDLSRVYLAVAFAGELAGRASNTDCLSQLRDGPRTQ